MTNTDDMSPGKLARFHLRTLEHRRSRLQETPGLDDERKALAFAIDILDRVRWRQTVDEWPRQGEAVIVASSAAGIGTAVLQGKEWLCTCGCEQRVPAVFAWHYGQVAPEPSTRKPR